MAHRLEMRIFAGNSTPSKSSQLKHCLGSILITTPPSGKSGSSGNSGRFGVSSFKDVTKFVRWKSSIRWIMSDSSEEHIGGRGVVVREVRGGRVGLPPVVVVVEVVVVVVVVDEVVGRRFSKNSRISRTLFTRSHILEVILFQFSMMCNLQSMKRQTYLSFVLASISRMERSSTWKQTSNKPPVSVMLEFSGISTLYGSAGRGVNIQSLLVSVTPKNWY